MNDAIRMQLSAFVDGELPENEAELLLRRMSQDADLRQQVGEFLALGRLIRDEAGLAATDRLHERIAAALDEGDGIGGETESTATLTTSRAMRPLAGAAIAAAVALVALFALQQDPAIDELPQDIAPAVVDNAVPDVDAQLERQRLYFRNHSETSSALGANGMNSRVVTFELSEELEVEPETDDDESDAAEVTQP